MKPRNRFLACLLICFLSFVISSLSLVVNSSDVVRISNENKRLEQMVLDLSGIIENQNKTIEIYKQHCDDVARCIVDGEW